MNQPNATTQAAQQSPKIKFAKVADYTGYDSRSGRNGGKYGFWEEYRYLGEGRYELTHHTTAQGFSFCECCGSFQDGCCERPQTVDEEVVWSAIKAAQSAGSSDIWAEYELFDVKEWIEKLRRRVRDALNKTTNEHTVISCAIVLDCKLD